MYLHSIGPNTSFCLDTTLVARSRPSVQARSLIDSGCSPFGFIDDQFVQKSGFTRRKLTHPRTLRLADGTVTGSVTDYCVVTTRGSR